MADSQCRRLFSKQDTLNQGRRCPPCAMSDFRFPKALRLLSPREFERVFAARLSAADPQIMLYGVANTLNHPRLGLAVSRKVGNAVARNRWKRLLREAFRLSQHELPPLDFVCVPRGGAPPTLAPLMESFTVLAHKIQHKHERRQHKDARPVPLPDERNAADS